MKGERVKRTLYRPLAVWTAGLVLGCVLDLSVRAFAQPGPSQPPTIEVLQNRVKDLMDYRNYVEDQLAIAKAVIQQQRTQIEQQQAEIQTLRHPAKMEPTK